MSENGVNNELEKGVRTHARRLKKAQDERNTLLTHASYLGVVGLVIALPIVAGAYLGRWLDGLAQGYSIRWTISLIFLGVVIGMMNLYFVFKDRE